VKGGSRIEGLSAGSENGNTARILVNGEDVLAEAKSGINVIVLDGTNHKIIYQGNYDTGKDQGAAARLAKDAQNTPKGAVVIAAVAGDAARFLSQEARDVFGSMGSKEIYSLAAHQGYFFTGVWGTQTNVEKLGGKVQAGMILGYSRVVKTTRTVKKVVKSRRTVTRKVVRKTVTETKNGVTTTRTVTRVRRVVRVSKSSSSSSTTVVTRS